MLEKPGKSNKGIGLDWIEAKGIAFCASFWGVEWVKGCTDFGVFNFPPRVATHWEKFTHFPPPLLFFSLFCGDLNKFEC